MRKQLPRLVKDETLKAEMRTSDVHRNQKLLCLSPQRMPGGRQPRGSPQNRRHLAYRAKQIPLKRCFTEAPPQADRPY